MPISLHPPSWSPIIAAAVALLSHAIAAAQDEPLPPGALARLGTLRFRHAADIGALAVTADGHRVASAGDDGKVYIFDRATGRQVHVLHASDKDSPPHHIIFSPNGKTLASCSKEDTRLWDVATGQMIRSLPESSDEMVFSPDGKFLAGMKRDKLCLWETSTGRQLWQWQSPRVFWNKSMAFSADGQTLIAGEMDGTIYFWDPATGKEKRHWSPLRSPAAMQLSSDGTTLAALEKAARRIHLWDVPSGRHLRCINPETSHKLARLALAADGKTLAAATDSEELVFCDAGRGKVTERRVVARGVACLCFVPGRRTLVTAGCGGVIRFWDSGSGKEIEPGVGHQAWISSLVFAPDGRTLYSAGADGTVRFWQVATGRQLRCLRTRYLFFVPLPQIALCQQGRLLALQGVGVHLYDTADGKEVRHIAQDVLVDAMAVSGGEKPVLAVGGESFDEQRGLTLWDVATGRQLRKKTDSDAPPLLYFSADGKSLVAGGWSEEGTRILDATTLKEVGRRPLSPGYGFALSADRRRLAVISQEHFVQLCEAGSCRKLFTFEKAPEPLHTLAFSADGATLAVADDECNIRLWETATGRQRGSFRGHRRGVQDLAFAPDGRTLASAGVDTTILLWDLPGLAGGKGTPPSQQHLQGLWKDLADRDAVRAYRAVWALAQFPDRSVSFLGSRLRPSAGWPAERLRELIRALGSDTFAVRQEAMRELEKAEDLAEPALRAALADEPDLEIRRRLELLLGKINERVRDPETLRAVRAIEALEHAGTAEARGVLENLAGGAEGARPTRQARTALERLSKRSARKPEP